MQREIVSLNCMPRTFLVVPGTLSPPSTFDCPKSHGNVVCCEWMTYCQPTVESVSEKLLELCAKHSPVVLIGHSSGGTVSLLAAIKHEIRKLKDIVGLIVIDTGANVKGHKDIRLHVEELSKKSIDHKFMESFIGNRVYGPISEEMLTKIKTYHHCIKGVESKCVSMLSSQVEAHLEVHLHQIRLKTLIIHGKHDTARGVHFAEEIHEKILGSELVILEDSGHFPLVEVPEQFAATVTAFIKII